jgi:hypothetical protein
MEVIPQSVGSVLCPACKCEICVVMPCFRCQKLVVGSKCDLVYACPLHLVCWRCRSTMVPHKYELCDRCNVDISTPVDKKYLTDRRSYLDIISRQLRIDEAVRLTKLAEHYSSLSERERALVRTDRCLIVNRLHYGLLVFESVVDYHLPLQTYDKGHYVCVGLDYLTIDTSYFMQAVAVYTSPHNRAVSTLPGIIYLQ